MTRQATLLPALQRTLVQAWTHRGLLAWLLWPVSLVFSALAALRRGLYKAGVCPVKKLSVPVVVVGNVVAGGSGKTPVVMALVRHLQMRGVKVGVISRGYGRTSKKCCEVFINSRISDVGDEPALIHRSTSAPVFVAPSRFEAGTALLARYPATQVIVCDDGLQHLGLYRDVAICVFDDRGVGNGFLLPAGPLREPWPRPVDLVLHTGAHPAFDGFTAQRSLAPYAVRADGSQVKLTIFYESKPGKSISNCSIARPNQIPDVFKVKPDNCGRQTGAFVTNPFTKKSAGPILNYRPRSINVELVGSCTKHNGCISLFDNRINPGAIGCF